MGVSINELAVEPTKKLYFDPKFRRVLESYMKWFRDHPETNIIPINPHDNYKYEGDFYGLLNAQGIPRDYHWIVMRVNNLYRPGDVRESMSAIKVPDFGTMDRIMQMYRTKTKKNLT